MSHYIYCRISKDNNGDKLGVERQEKACRDLAQLHGLKVSHVFVDNDISAHSGAERPAFQDMMKRLERGEARGIIVWHVDRLYRRLVDLEKIVDVVERTKAEIRTVNAGDLDLNTATGRMLARILGSTASYEVEHAQERLKASIVQRAEQGRWLGGQAPYGLDFHPTEKGNLIVVPEQAKITQEAVRRLLRGEGILGVVTDFNRRGLTSKRGGRWRSSGLRSLVTSPSIAGLATLHGSIIGKGVWPAIVDEGDWYALQELLNDPARKTNRQGRVRKWQGAGTYECGRCGEKLRPAKYAGSRTQGYRCYGCSLQCKQAELDALVDTLVVGYLDKPENRLRVVRQDDDATDFADLTERRALLVARKNRLGALFADGQIDDAQLTSGTVEIGRQLEGIDAQLAQARSSSPLAEMMLSGDDLADHWAALTPDVRAQIIGMLMKVILLPVEVRGRATPVIERVDIQWKE